MAQQNERDYSPIFWSIFIKVERERITKKNDAQTKQRVHMIEGYRRVQFEYRINWTSDINEMDDDLARTLKDSDVFFRT